jgi:hypothetical protein
MHGLSPLSEPDRCLAYDSLPASGQQVTQVIDPACPLLKVELDPVVEPNHLALLHLPNKHCEPSQNLINFQSCVAFLSVPAA